MENILAWLISNLFIFMLLLSFMLLAAIVAFLFMMRLIYERKQNKKLFKMGTVFLGIGTLASLGLASFLSNVLEEVWEVYSDEQRFVGTQVPMSELTNIHTGEHLTLDSFKGKTLVVNQWATWCGPCEEEMPALEKFQRNYESQNVEVIYVSEEDSTEIKAFLEKRKGKSGLDARADKLPWQISTLPSTLIVDSEGEVKKVLTGGQTYEQFQSAIKPVL